jgi:hypothetical protein
MGIYSEHNSGGGKESTFVSAGVLSGAHDAT